MKMRLFLFAFFAGIGLVNAQSPKADSLFAVLQTAKADTNKVNALNSLSKELRGGNPDTAIVLNREALKLATQLNFLPGIALSHHLLGIMLYNTGNYTGALEEDKKAIVCWKKLYPPDGAKRAAATLGNMGLVYVELGNYPQALENYFNALKYGEKAKDQMMITSTHSNIGLVFFQQKNYKAALEHFTISSDINTALMASADKATAKGGKSKQAVVLGNIGNVYYEQGDPDKALDFYFKALKMREELGLKALISSTLGNIGSMYADKAKKKTVTAAQRTELYKTALEYMLRAQKIAEEIGDQGNAVYDLNNIGTIYLDLKHYTEARGYLEKSLVMANAMGIKTISSKSYKNLSILDSAEGKQKEALDHYKLFIAYRDSLNNEENTKQTVRLEMNYEFEKKEAAGKLEQEKKEAVAAAESKKQRIVLILVSCVLALVFIFAVFAYRSYLQKQKANEEITKQKDVIEEKQKEILDSIYYARRIQRSLLTGEKYIDKSLKKLNKQVLP